MKIYDVKDIQIWKDAYEAFMNLLSVCNKLASGYATLARACGNSQVHFKKFHGVVLASAPSFESMRGTSYEAGTEIITGLMVLKEELDGVYLADIVAYPEKHGYGACLIHAAKVKAKSLGHHVLKLHAADDSLVGYYERYGFVPVSKGSHNMTCQLDED